ncbi:MAG: PQQ-dependent sugar dehydrogenase [Solirubrobacterales bacterium]
MAGVSLHLRRRLLGLAILALLGGIVALGAPERAPAATLPTGFQEDVVFSGLTEPTAVRFSADGRVFVAERSGLIKVFDSLSDSTPTVFADLRTNVHSFWDRGLLGLALDPDFPIDPYVYVLYAYDFDPSVPGDFPRWGTPGVSSDPCPNPPGATGDGCVVTGRLSRLQVSGNQMVGPEQVLIEDWCQQYPSHSIGALEFGDDGALYVSGGDGASFSFVDYGHEGSPVNPCGDPPGGVGATLTPPSAEGGALRSQDLRSAADPTSLDGAILRVNPSTGAPMPGNPTTSGDTNARRIVAYGFRNPFRFTIRPGTNEIWAGDVGWGTWEEINRITNPVASPVANLGWPCYEGSLRQSGYDGHELSMCESLYNAGPGAVVGPYFQWNHSSQVVSGESCPTGGSSISGLAFYEGGNYPSQYDDALFFADYARSCIWAMFPGANGLPNPGNRITFAAGAPDPVDLQIGPGGNLFYVDFGGTVRRIRHFSANQPPTARAAASPQSGPAPLAVNFDGTGSSDPDPGDSLTYAWDLDGDGLFDDSTSPTPSHEYDVGTHTVRLRVTDEEGESDTSDPVTINAGNTAPSVTIDAPTALTTWRVGEQIAFSGRATDPQEGTLPASALSWSLSLEHCPSNCHTHPIQSFPATAGGTFNAPDHEYPSHLELRVTATDSGGLQDTETLPLHPKTVELGFDSSPVAGIDLTVDAQSEPTPFTRTVIVGSSHSVAAPATVPGTPVYSFDSWSDGGGRIHDIVAPADPTTYTAKYRAGVPTAVARAEPSVGDAPLPVQFDGTGSSDPDPGDSLTYAWDLDGDGRFDDSTSPTPTRTYGVGTHTVRLRVTDQLSNPDVDTLAITARNTPPVVAFDAPRPEESWRAGEAIRFSAHALDPQDGRLPPSAFSWSALLGECAAGCPERTFLEGVGPAGSFEAPDRANPSSLEIVARAVDRQGLSSTGSVSLDPRTVPLRFRSRPVKRVRLVVEGDKEQTSFRRRLVLGSTVRLRAPRRLQRRGAEYLFDHWSDHEPRIHEVTVKTRDERYTAVYERR